MGTKCALCEEVVVGAQVVIGFVRPRGENEQDSVGAVAVLSAPDHLGHEDAHVRAVERDFAAPVTVVQEHPAGAVKADKELLAALVSVLTSQLDRGHAEDSEVAGGRERHFGGHFAHGERAPSICNAAHQVQRAPADIERDAGRTWKMAEALDVDEARVGATVECCAVHVADDLRGVAFHDGVRGDGAEHDGAGANPGALADRDALSNHTGRVETRVCADDDVVASQDDALAKGNAGFDSGAVGNDAVVAECNRSAHEIF